MTEWVKARPNSVTAKIALANLWWQSAWKARGGGYANTVNDQGWKLMEEREGYALGLLNDAKKLKETCPRWYYTMLQIAKDQSWDKARYDAIFNESIAKYPDYKSSYFSKVLDLQPRWGGAAGEWEQFIAQSADKVGGENGDKFYAQMVWAVEFTHWYHKGNIFREFKISYPRVKKGFEILMKEYPNSLSVTSAYCHAATASGDRQEAAMLFAKLGGRVDCEVWWSEQSFLSWRNWVFTGI